MRALGRLEILRAGVPVPPESWGYAKPRELLLYLLAHADGRTREQVGLDFWPEISAAQVKNNFHVTLHHLRKALGDPGLIRFERGRYRVAIEAGVVFDAALFEQEVPIALKRLKAAPADTDAGLALARALARHRGGFLEEEQAGDWHLALRDRVARLYDDALQALAEHHVAAGAHAEAAEVFRRLVDADPLHEEAVCNLMLALARSGRRADAIKAYERFAAVSRAEFGAEPEKATRALADRIRQGATS
jgi:DNA-binding SARP family transcriptional activator